MNKFFVVVLSIMVVLSSACDFFGEEVVKKGNVVSNNDNTNNLNNTNDSNNVNNTNNTNETNNTNVELCGNGVLDYGELCDSVADDGSLAEEIHFAAGSTIHNCSEDEIPVFDCNSSCNVVVECVPTGVVDEPECGNGVLEEDEECDGSDIPASASCEVVMGGSGWQGTVACDTNCMLIPGNCWYDEGSSNTASCGNGVLESGEACDGGTTETCESLYGSNYTGTVSCSGNCQLSTSCIYNSTSTSSCGDDVIDSGEACDGSNFNGATCASYGFNSGSLICSSNCSGISTAGCYNTVVVEPDPVVCIMADSGYTLEGAEVVHMDGSAESVTLTPGNAECGRQILVNGNNGSNYLTSWVLSWSEYNGDMAVACNVLKDMGHNITHWNGIQVWVNPTYGQVVDNTSCPSGLSENYTVPGTTKKVCGVVEYGIVSNKEDVPADLSFATNLLIGEPGHIMTPVYSKCTPGTRRLYWGQNESVPH